MKTKIVLLLMFFLTSIFSFPAHGQVIVPNMFRKVSDFDGDLKADFAVTRNENGLKVWYVWQSTNGFKVFQWGIGTDQNAAGDFNGDGITDFAIFRSPSSSPAFYTFHIIDSQTNIYTIKSFSSGLGGAPVHQDFNGDGRVDACANTGIGEVGLGTPLECFYSGLNTGFATSIPPRNISIRIGDMDGDGRADKAHYSTNGNIVTITNLVTSVSREYQFGLSDDLYQMADFDGDGIGDLTVFRGSTGTWWWIQSSDNSIYAVQWGKSGDTPVPADYDGDGKTDLAIWRPGTPQSQFWVLGSQNGARVFSFGIATDRAVKF
jgi:hypothetical protein